MKVYYVIPLNYRFTGHPENSKIKLCYFRERKFSIIIIIIIIIIIVIIIIIIIIISIYFCKNEFITSNSTIRLKKQ